MNCGSEWLCVEAVDTAGLKSGDAQKSFCAGESGADRFETSRVKY